MRAAVRLLVPASLALALAACGGDAPSTGAPDIAERPVEPAPSAPAARPLEGVDSATLRQRAADALAANRLYTPAGDNAVEDYLALREREPADPGLDAALVDLAPYVMIGAEQATLAEDFAGTRRLVDLLARIDASAPAVPRVRGDRSSPRGQRRSAHGAAIQAALRPDADPALQRAVEARGAPRGRSVLTRCNVKSRRQPCRTSRLGVDKKLTNAGV